MLFLCFIDHDVAFIQITCVCSCSWLRLYAVNQEVTDSNTDEAIGNVNMSNPSSHTMDLEFTHSVTEMSTRKYF